MKRNMIGKFQVKRETHAFHFSREEYNNLIAAELLRRRTLIEIAKNNTHAADQMKKELEVKISSTIGQRRFTQLKNSLKANSVELVNVTIYL